jgi:hypothetical protein
MEGVVRIERIDKAACAYPYGAAHRPWPGPNSNTFTAWIMGRCRCWKSIS